MRLAPLFLCSSGILWNKARKAIELATNRRKKEELFQAEPTMSDRQSVGVFDLRKLVLGLSAGRQ